MVVKLGAAGLRKRVLAASAGVRGASSPARAHRRRVPTEPLPRGSATHHLRLVAIEQADALAAVTVAGQMSG